MTIVFLLASLSQPRCIKRILGLQDKGHHVIVYGYTRGFYDVNCLPKGIEVHNLGKVESGGGYWGKAYKNLINIKKIIKNHPKSMIYAFGFDFSFWLYFLGFKMYIYESSDLIYTYFKSSLIRNLFKTIDKKIIKKSYKTIFTSEGFVEYLYPNLRPTNIIVQPNRVSPLLKFNNRYSIDYTNKKGLVFSYVGALRYPNTVFRFAKIIGEKYPHHQFYFHGDSEYTPLAKELSSKFENVKYFGKFKSPEDLPKIYNNIDVVVACYDAQTINEQIAEPNKLYESICFCKPIIVSNNTFLARRVQKLNVGFSLDATQDESIITFLDNLKLEQLNEKSFAAFNLSEQIYVDSIEQINEILN